MITWSRMLYPEIRITFHGALGFPGHLYGLQRTGASGATPLSAPLRDTSAHRWARPIGVKVTASVLIWEDLFVWSPALSAPPLLLCPDTLSCCWSMVLWWFLTIRISGSSLASAYSFGSSTVDSSCFVGHRLLAARSMLPTWMPVAYPFLLCVRVCLLNLWW